MSEKYKFREFEGITLISLVITIIILIILAGVAINLSLGENGIFRRAKEAKNKYLLSAEGEQRELNELYKQLGIENLPENTKENPQEIGKEVALKDGWGQETVKYTSTKNGQEEKNLTKVATVYAVSVGNGDTVPVPKNFYYVGGTINDGVIISDNEEDRYRYNPETKKENDTTLDKTTHEYAPSLKGNQFVWIPCETKDYKKNTNWNGTIQKNGTLANANWDTSTNSAEKTQIEKYGGFYVGRYEAGTSNIQGIDFVNITTTGWATDAALYTKVTSGNITSKANEIPYYHANYSTAVEMCEKMYKDDVKRNKYVNSGLITGTMWDVMINVMNKKTGCDLTKSNWGNNMTLKDNQAIPECRGYHCEVNSSGGHNAWSTSNNYTKPNNTRVILSTGATNFTQKMHLYDVAGNLWECTQELAFNKDSAESIMIRGGSFNDIYNDAPACHRANFITTSTYTYSGFRPVLYIK